MSKEVLINPFINCNENTFPIHCEASSQLPKEFDQQMGFWNNTSIRCFCKNFSKLEGETCAAYTQPLCTVTPFAPYPADPSGLNPSANLFWIHLSSYLTYREKSTALKILLSNSSLLLPRLLFPQNQLFCFEVDRTGRKFYFCTCPSSCLSLTWVLHPPDTRWAPTLPPVPTDRGPEISQPL